MSAMWGRGGGAPAEFIGGVGRGALSVLLDLTEGDLGSLLPGPRGKLDAPLVEAASEARVDTAKEFIQLLRIPDRHPGSKGRNRDPYTLTPHPPPESSVQCGQSSREKGEGGLTRQG